jgi:hypothetical protein
MAAKVRSDRRIALACATECAIAEAGVRHRRRRVLPMHKCENGCVDPHLSQHAKTNHHGHADRQGPVAAASSPGHEHEDQGPRA